MTRASRQFNAKLNEKQKRFVEAFLRHGDAPRAASEAGYLGSPITVANYILTFSAVVQKAIKEGKANGKKA